MQLNNATNNAGTFINSMSGLLKISTLYFFGRQVVLVCEFCCRMLCGQEIHIYKNKLRDHRVCIVRICTDKWCEGDYFQCLRFSLKINKTDGRARVGGNEDVRELEGGGECGFGL